MATAPTGNKRCSPRDDTIAHRRDQVPDGTWIRSRGLSDPINAGWIHSLCRRTLNEWISVAARRDM